MLIIVLEEVQYKWPCLWNTVMAELSWPENAETCCIRRMVDGITSRWPHWHFMLCTVRRRFTWRLSLLALLTCLTGEGCDLHYLISLMFRPSACQLSAVVSFRLLVLRSGTAYQMMSPPLRPCQPSGAIWRHLFRCCYNTLWFCCTYSDYSGPRGGVDV